MKILHSMNKLKIAKYYWTTKSKLPYIPKEKKKFTLSLRRSLYSYLEEHPLTTIDEIYSEFGTVEQLCEDYTENMTQEQLMNGVKYTRRINRYLFVLVAILFILCVGFYIYLYLNSPPYRHYILFENFAKHINDIIG